MTGTQFGEIATFRTIHSSYVDEEQTSQDLYGVEVTIPGSSLFEANDLTADRERVEQFVTLCNSQQIARCHARDVVEDFLTDLYLY